MMRNPYVPLEGYAYKTVPEAAKILGIAVSTIEKLIREKKIASAKIGGTRRIMFRKADLEEQQMLDNYEEILVKAEHA